MGSSLEADLAPQFSFLYVLALPLVREAPHFLVQHVPLRRALVLYPLPEKDVGLTAKHLGSNAVSVSLSLSAIVPLCSCREDSFPCPIATRSIDIRCSWKAVQKK